MENYDFEVPLELVKSEARSLAQSQVMPYMHMLKGQDESILKGMIENMAEASMDQALAKVRADLVLESLAKNLGFENTEEEITKELEDFLPYSEEKSLEDLRKNMEDRGGMESLHDMLKRRKGLEAIREAAVLTEVDELTPETPPEMPERGPEIEAEVTDVADASAEPDASDEAYTSDKDETTVDKES